MTDSADLVLNQAVVEVQYDRGVVYLDKCGALTLRLQDELGRPFVPIPPNMETGEFKNGAERIAVRYGPKSFSVTQTWVRSPARVEQLAPAAWGHVADVLDVGRTVTRCGVRFQLVFSVESPEDGEARIAESKLCVESPEWISAFGTPTSRGWVCVSEDHRGKLRSGLSVIQVTLEGGPAPSDLADLIPKAAILLDLDHVYPCVSGEHFGLQKAPLKDFIRAAWQRSKQTAMTIRKALELPDPPHVHH